MQIRSRKIIFSFILLLFIVLLPIRGGIYFRHLGKTNGLSQLSVMSIYQDEFGRMWFGTLEGISMFNGKHTIAFKPSKTKVDGKILMGNDCYSITGDRNGNIFFCSSNKLIRYNMRTEQFSCLYYKGVNCLSRFSNRVWVCVKDSILCWNSKRQKFELSFISPVRNSIISDMHYDYRHRFWLGTNRGLYLIEKKKFRCLIPNNSISNLFEDSKHNMWVALFRNGMYCVTNKGKLIKYLPVKGKNSISNLDVRTFAEDNLGNIWIGTFQGLNKLDKKGVFSCYNKNNLPGCLHHGSIFSLYKDCQGSIWVGTYYGGVHYFNPETDIFSYYSENASRNDCLGFFFVGNMVEDKHHDVWICTEGAGLDQFHSDTKLFTHYPFNNLSDLPHKNLKCIAYDATLDNLYFGVHPSGIISFNVATKKMKYYNEFSNRIGTAIKMQVYGSSLYILSIKGVFEIDLKTGKPKSTDLLFKADVDGTFFIDSKGTMWIATTSSLLKINLKDKKRIIHTYRFGQKGLSIFPILSIVEDKQGHVFFGSEGAGLFEYSPRTDRFISYTASNKSLLSDYCYNMVVSPKGYLLLLSDEGLTFFDPINKIVKKTIEANTTHFLSSLNKGCGLLYNKDGNVFVGSAEGMTTFYEPAIWRRQKDYNLYFSTISINGKWASPQSGLLKQAIPFVDKIDLKYNQNNLVIYFSSNDYTNNVNQVRYEYCMKGLNNNWLPNRGEGIVFSQLPPGTYTLIVREKPIIGHASPHSIELKIVIHRPWYATFWAYMLYLIIIGSVVYKIYQLRTARKKIQLSFEDERREKEKNEEIMKAKIQFFSNISHELRTPLTLIISQIELLLQNKNVPIQNRIMRIYNNAKHLQDLIIELLNFNKIKGQGILLKLSDGDLSAFLKTVYDTFIEEATLHSITYKCNIPNKPLPFCFDEAQLQKVFYNILSNAFKFTPDNGRIELQLEERDTDYCVKVMDNGIGIDKDSLDKIFDYFYKAKQTDNRNANGMGIGLALSKEIVESHHGMISVQSAIGYGSIFSVILPKTAVPESPDVEVHSINNEDTETLNDNNESVASFDDNKPTILIVEDNRELLEILTTLFSPMYDVLKSLNGEEGFEMAKKNMPDIILSDIVMPIMSGTDMCLKIKNNFDLCHIPVVLLTALTSGVSNIEGLQCGADDYIHKPFNNKLLLARCNNLITSRKLLKQKYESNSVATDVQELATNTIDQKFLSQLNELIELHISDVDLDISYLTREMGVSRTALYNKLKVLSGMTPHKFILTTKLKHAANMLRKQPDLQITDIAYQLGFSSLRYFSHCFKEQFGVTPNEYKKQVK